MITIKKNLRSGQSVWKAYATPRISSTELKKDLKTDVIVVGAGISGSFGSTATGLRLIGPIPGLPAVMPFGRNGIISSRLGAEIIHRYLTGKMDTHADLYKFKN